MKELEIYRCKIKISEVVSQFIKEIYEVVIEKGLSSYMNDTKWLKFQKEILGLPFPPAYNVKYVHLSKEES